MFSITQVRVLALRLTVFGKGGGSGSETAFGESETVFGRS